MRSLIKAGMLAFILFACITLKAQTFKATYTYDASGNRVNAKVVYLTQSLSSPSTDDETKSKVEEELKVDDVTNLTISIFPNPTKGDLRVELTGATLEQLNAPNNALKVWDLQGRLLFSINPLGSSNTVDLSKYSNGIYIMQLFFNGKGKDFKIIKN